MESNHFKLGLFVCFTLTLFVVLILSLGFFDSWKPKAHMVALFPESVQGLSIGSSVKYMGVPIGSVSDISISITSLHDDDDDGIMEVDRMIRVDMEVDLYKFKTQSGDTGSLFTQSQFKQIIISDMRQGLRCVLSPDGITGSQYVSLEFIKNPAPVRNSQFDVSDPNTIYVASAPSMLKDLRTGVFDLLDRLNSIDFATISDKIIAMLNSIQNRVDNPDITSSLSSLSKTLARLEEMSAVLQKNLTGQVLNELRTSVLSGIKQINDLSSLMKTEIEKAQVAQTVKEFRMLMNSWNELSLMLSSLAVSLDETLDSSTELIQNVEADPSSLIRGKGRVNNEYNLYPDKK